MTTTPTPPLALPALPEPHTIVGQAGRHCVIWGRGYDAADMNAHATAAILSDRAGSGDAAPVAQPPATAEAERTLQLFENHRNRGLSIVGPLEFESIVRAIEKAQGIEASTGEQSHG